MTATEDPAVFAHPVPEVSDNRPLIGVDLASEQAFACAFRLLGHEEFCEDPAGHITWRVPGTDHLLVNPLGMLWSEISTSDISVVDPDGNQVAGRWGVTPVIHMHTEIHRRRPDAQVVIHNHPYHACVLAAIGVLPSILNQTATLFDNDVCLITEYRGDVTSPLAGAEIADALGEYSVAILANHGVIVTGRSLEEAVFRASQFDRVCRMTYDVMLLGRDPLPIPESVRSRMKAALTTHLPDIWWAGRVRQLLRREPDVLM